MSFWINGVNSGINGRLTLPGDKSISHRAVILGALAKGKIVIKNFAANEDCLATISALKKIGIKVSFNKASSRVIIYGKGLFNLRKPQGPIFIKESGTTFRLFLGLLAGQNFDSLLCAGKSLSVRPMRRVTAPLRLMGAKLDARIKNKDEYPPINIEGRNLKGISYRLSVASAQVKSAILLAGLFACGKTRIIEKVKTRDHTERMFKLFKANIKINGKRITLDSNKELVSPGYINIPADISSAAFFMVAALILPNSRLLLKEVSLNPGRTGIVKVLRRMGAKITIIAKRHKGNEPTGDILVKSSDLKGVIVEKNEIPGLIDELPVLMLAASVAKGSTILKGISELRVKETDRVKSMVENLIKLGVCVKVSKLFKEENIRIIGVKELRGAKVQSFGDHRTAMSMVIAGLKATGRTEIDNVSCISKSFPKFTKVLKSLI